MVLRIVPPSTAATALLRAAAVIQRPAARASSRLLSSSSTRYAAFSPPQSQSQSLQPPPPPPPPQPQSPPPPHRWWLPRFSTVVFFGLGVAAAAVTGSVLRLADPPAPPRGSPEEAEAVAQLAARGDQLPLVQELAASPQWEDWTVGSRWQAGEAEAKGPPERGDTTGGGDVVSEADMEDTPASPRVRLTRDALGGSYGLTGYHRIFHNPTTGEIMSIVYLGRGLSGFPGMAHGGALATLIDEALGRCAIHALPARTGVTARLELEYRRTAAVPAFYAVHCVPELPRVPLPPLPSPPDSPADPPAPPKELRKLWCHAKLYKIGDSRTPVVEAKALFVVPSRYKLGRVEDRF